MKRRKFLKIAGSTGVVLAAAGAGGFVATRDPVKARQPWENAGAVYPDPMRRALSYAILAPNPHNRQPWQVRLVSDTEAELLCDLERLLPDTDPFSRQIVIGLGCFIELFAEAASHEGYRADIALFPQGEPGERLDTRPIARLRLVADNKISPDPLFTHALHRHTNRNPYDLNRPIAEQDLARIRAAATPDVITGTAGQGERLIELRQLARDALRGEILDPVAYQESVDLMRIGRGEIEANPDGISLGGPFLETLSLLGMLDREQLADPESDAFQIGLDMADSSALTATGFVWINTRGNRRGDQIAAGRSYLRVALRAAGLGLEMQPMSQALQEYEAMQPYYSRVHEMLTSGPDQRVQMLSRLGYAEPVGPSPRWALQTRIIAS